MTQIAASWYISCSQAAGQVDTLNDIITNAPPLWQRFVGLTLVSLEIWLTRTFGKVMKVPIRCPECGK